MSGPEYVLGKMRATTSDGVVHAVWKVDSAASKGRAVMTACGIQLFLSDGATPPRQEVGCLTCLARGG